MFYNEKYGITLLLYVYMWGIFFSSSVTDIDKLLTLCFKFLATELGLETFVGIIVRIIEVNI